MTGCRTKFEQKFSKNKLVTKNTVAKVQESCSLRVDGLLIQSTPSGDARLY